MESPLIDPFERPPVPPGGLFFWHVDFARLLKQVRTVPVPYPPSADVGLLAMKPTALKGLSLGNVGKAVEVSDFGGLFAFYGIRPCVALDPVEAKLQKPQKSKERLRTG